MGRSKSLCEDEDNPFRFLKNYGRGCWYTRAAYTRFSTRLVFSTGFESLHAYHFNLGLGMKTKIIRDVPIGVLLCVLFLWCVALVQYLSGWPNFLTLIGIFFLSVIGHKLLLVGFDVIVGIQVEDKNDKK